VRTALAAVLLMVAPATPTVAQVAAPSFQRLEYHVESAALFPSCSAPILGSLECIHHESAAAASTFASRAPDHRYEGMAIGGGIGAVLGVLVGIWACQMSEDPDANCATRGVVGGLGGAVLVGFVGMMIGAQFPKGDQEPAPADSLTSRVSSRVGGHP
jgi:hypothetical protein